MTGERTDRSGLMLDPRQHHPIVLGALPQGEQQRAIVSREVCFRGGREDEVEPDHGRAAVEDVAQHATELGGPQRLGRAAEGRAAIRLFINSDNCDGRVGRSRSVEEPRAQQQQPVQGRTAQPLSES